MSYKCNRASASASLQFKLPLTEAVLRCASVCVTHFGIHSKWSWSNTVTWYSMYDSHQDLLQSKKEAVSQMLDEYKVKRFCPVPQQSIHLPPSHRCFCVSTNGFHKLLIWQKCTNMIGHVLYTAAHTHRTLDWAMAVKWNSFMLCFVSWHQFTPFFQSLLYWQRPEYIFCS